MIQFSPKGGSSIEFLEGVNLTPSYSYTMDFPNVSSQAAYFTSKVEYTYSNYQYIRQDNAIRIPVNVEDTYTIDYVRYVNSGGRTIYAFVLDRIYLNDNLTSLIIQTDIMQTFMFDYSLAKCMVAREHTIPKDVTLLDEGFEIGSEYEKVSSKTLFQKDLSYLVIISSIKKPIITENVIKKKSATKVGEWEEHQAFARKQINIDWNEEKDSLDITEVPVNEDVVTVLNGVPYPFLFMPMDARSIAVWSNIISNCPSVVGIVRTDKAYQGTTITKKLWYLDRTMKTESIDIQVIKSSEETISVSEMAIRQPRITGDIFNSYPFSYSLLTDYVNAPLLLRHEYMQGTTFGQSHSYGTEPSSRYWINNYCGDSEGKVHNITNSNVMSLPVKSEAIANYLWTNKNAMDEQVRQSKQGSAFGVVGSMLGIASSMAVGSPIGVAGSISSGVQSVLSPQNTIKSQQAKINDTQNTPPSIMSMGRIGSDIAFGTNKVDLVEFTIKQSVKDRILDYWNRFGYKSLQYKIPNTNSRSDFNYIQTTDCRVNGAIDSNVRQKLESIYNTGITIHHGRLN